MNPHPPRRSFWGGLSVVPTTHWITVAQLCGHVISQCRCPGVEAEAKTVQRSGGVCGACAERIARDFTRSKFPRAERLPPPLSRVETVIPVERIERLPDSDDAKQLGMFD